MREAIKHMYDICEAADLTPLFTEVERPANYRTKRPVRCNKCGLEFEALITKQRARCPICGQPRSRDKHALFIKYTNGLKARGWEPLFTEEEFIGPRNKEGKYQQYPVRCTKCGHTTTVAVYAHTCRTCPQCSSREYQTFKKAQELLISEGYTLLFKYEDWVGVNGEYLMQCNSCGEQFRKYIARGSRVVCPKCGTLKDQSRKSTLQIQCSKTGVTYLRTEGKYCWVRCSTCGVESRHYIYSHAGYRCPICHGGLTNVVNSYQKFLYLCKRCNYTSLVSLDEYKGLQGNKYKVRCNRCGKEFETYYYTRTKLLSPCPCFQVTSTYRSTRERMIENFLISKGVRVIACDREVLHGREIDIYCPEQKVAFEINGQWFHSSSDLNPQKKARNYHEVKTKAALNAGIRLYHLWEDTSDDLVLSIIESKLGICPNTLFARKLQVDKNTPSSEAALFFEASHVDGNNNTACHYYSLKDEHGIACCLSLMRRFNQSLRTWHWEIGRFANRKHTTVVGGYSRLLKYAVADLKAQGVTELVSYCNADLSPDPTATFYAKHGFQFVKSSGPIYWYWARRSKILNGVVYPEGRIARQACQKQKLLKHFADNNLGISEGATESDLTQALGLVPVFNSGNYKYTLKIK